MSACWTCGWFCYGAFVRRLNPFIAIKQKKKKKMKWNFTRKWWECLNIWISVWDKHLKKKKWNSRNWFLCHNNTHTYIHGKHVSVLYVSSISKQEIHTYRHKNMAAYTHTQTNMCMWKDFTHVQFAVVLPIEDLKQNNRISAEIV